MPNYQEISPIHPQLLPYIKSHVHISGEGAVPSKMIHPKPGATIFLDFNGWFSSFLIQRTSVKSLSKDLEESAIGSGSQQSTKRVLTATALPTATFLHLSQISSHRNNQIYGTY